MAARLFCSLRDITYMPRIAARYKPFTEITWRCSLQRRQPSWLQQQQRPRFQYYSSQQKPEPGKLKRFMKKYGYVGVGVYLGFSVLDLGLTMALIQIKGADKVEQLEQWIISKLKTSVGISVPPTPVHHLTAETESQRQPSWTSLFLLAYGIHKTLLLPVRLSLTAAVTPMIAKRLARLGWIRRRSLPKKSQ